MVSFYVKNRSDLTSHWINTENIMIFTLRATKISPEEENLLTELLNIMQEPRGYLTLITSEPPSPEKSIIQKIQELIVIPNQFTQEFCMLMYLAKNKQMALKDKFTYFKRDLLQWTL